MAGEETPPPQPEKKDNRKEILERKKLRLEIKNLKKKFKNNTNQK